MPDIGWKELETNLNNNENFAGSAPSVISENDDEAESFPCIYELFSFYNETFFSSRLKHVEVGWSSRMTLCAGVCTYNVGGYCSIRLSEPLLKYRSVKELKETLLHEMIHAYLFVTKKITSQDNHGPDFLYHMHKINDITGLNITVYHSFTTEVDYYRRHIWRCNGPCRNRPPFFGFVKRAINRAPSFHDFWWSEHQRCCGGVYEKVADAKSSDAYRSSTLSSSKTPRSKRPSKTKKKEVYQKQNKTQTLLDFAGWSAQ